MNNIFYRGQQPNRLYKIVPSGNDVDIQPLDIGDALEPHGFGTGKDPVFELKYNKSLSYGQPANYIF